MKVADKIISVILPLSDFLTCLKDVHAKEKENYNSRRNSNAPRVAPATFCVR